MSNAERLRRDFKDFDSVVNFISELTETSNKEYLTAFCQLDSVCKTLSAMRATYTQENAPQLLNLDESVPVDSNLSEALEKVQQVSELLAEHLLVMHKSNLKTSPPISPRQSPETRRRPSTRRHNSLPKIRFPRNHGDSDKDIEHTRVKFSKTASNEQIITYLVHAPGETSPRKVRKKRSEVNV